MGENYYLDVKKESLFEIKKPVGVNAIGVDSLPNHASESLILGDAFITQFSNLLDNLNILLTALGGEPLIPAAAASANLIKDSIDKIKDKIPNLTSKSVKTA